MIRFQNIGVPRDFQMENKTNIHKKICFQFLYKSLSKKKDDVLMNNLNCIFWHDICVFSIKTVKM